MHGVSNVFFPPRCTAPKPITCVGLLSVWLRWRVGLPLHGSLSRPVNIISTGMTPREDGIFDSVCQEECAESQKKKKSADLFTCVWLQTGDNLPALCQNLSVTQWDWQHTAAIEFQPIVKKAFVLDFSGCFRSSLLNCTRPRLHYIKS